MKPTSKAAKEKSSSTTASQGATKGAGGKDAAAKKGKFENSWVDQDFNEGGSDAPKGGREATK